ncbi:MAG: DUF402 domain-containing protein [Deltaproteobacteria bacterium]|nr:DUF402 domain-containing protein [Deltaproteobacteria bacterium]
MDRPGIKIRGIYTTALTRLLLEGGYRITDPSDAARERFPFDVNDEGLHDIQIRDRPDRQGVTLVGEWELTREIVIFLLLRLPDMIVSSFETPVNFGEQAKAAVEFPSASKAQLDVVRSGVLPTVRGHHRLRLIDPRELERQEEYLSQRPGDCDRVGTELFRELVFLPLARESLARIEHVRVNGKVINLGEGSLAAADAANQRVVVRRFFRGGRYDGLDLPIEEGDYALTECREGDLFVRHTYYSRMGVSKGIYVNINTPVELYPWGVRYVDLEVDVIRRAGEDPFVVDREKLRKITVEGFISPALEERAAQVAAQMLDLLKERQEK